MAKIIKVIEMLAQSEKSWEDAAQTAVTEASKTLRHIRSIYIKAKTLKHPWITAKSFNTESMPRFPLNLREQIRVECADRAIPARLQG